MVLYKTTITVADVLSNTFTWLFKSGSVVTFLQFLLDKVPRQARCNENKDTFRIAGKAEASLCHKGQGRVHAAPTHKEYKKNPLDSSAQLHLHNCHQLR